MPTRILLILTAVFFLFADSRSDDHLSYENRKSRLIDQSIAYFEQEYDKSAEMVRASEGKNSQEDGFSRDTIWLSLCYFMKGSHLKEANDLLSKGLEFQEKSGAEIGNFRKFYRDQTVEDRNVGLFLLPSLAYIYHQHSDKLLPEVREELAEALELGRQAVINLVERKHVPFWYENIFFSLIDCLIILGEEETALQLTREYLDFVEQFGINEYAAQNYVIVQLASLQSAWVHAERPELKKPLRDLLDFRWQLFVHELHPSTMMISSVASRAKGSGALKQNQSILTATYLYFGDGEVEAGSKPRVELLLVDCFPSEEIQAIYRNRMRDSLEWQTRSSRVDIQVYQTPDYSLSTQSGRRSTLGIRDFTKYKLSSATQEADLVLTFTGDEMRKGVRFRTYGYKTDSSEHDDNFNHHWITSVQNKNRAVVSFNHDPIGKNIDQVYSEARLGRADSILQSAEGLLINGSRWNEQPTALACADSVAYSMGNVYIGLRFLESDPIRITGHAKINDIEPVELTVEEGELILRNYLAYDKNLFHCAVKNRRMGYVVEVVSADEFSSLKKFADHLTDLQVLQTVSGTVHTVVCEGDGRRLMLKEDLDKNIILSRQINGREFNNSFLLRSKYVSRPVGSFESQEISVEGLLEYPPPPPPVAQPFSAEFEAEEMFLMGAMTAEGTQGSIRTAERFRGEAAQGVNIPYSGSWKIWVRTKIAEEGTVGRIRWNEDNAGFSDVLLKAKGSDSFGWIPGPVCRLHQGAHVLRIFGGETGAEIDRVFLTNNLTEHPGSAESR